MSANKLIPVSYSFKDAETNNVVKDKCKVRAKTFEDAQKYLEAQGCFDVKRISEDDD